MEDIEVYLINQKRDEEGLGNAGKWFSLPLSEEYVMETIGIEEDGFVELSEMEPDFKNSGLSDYVTIEQINDFYDTLERIYDFSDVIGESADKLIDDSYGSLDALESGLDDLEFLKNETMDDYLKEELDELIEQALNSGETYGEMLAKYVDEDQYIKEHEMLYSYLEDNGNLFIYHD